MELFNMIVAIAEGLTIICGLLAFFIRPIREKITRAKERERKAQENFEELKSEIKEIKADIKKVQDKQKNSEKDELRTQLLMLIADYPSEKAEIMKLSEHYFGDLSGNWYLTSLFNKWLEDNHIAKPEWFKEG